MALTIGSFIFRLARLRPFAMFAMLAVFALLTGCAAAGGEINAQVTEAGTQTLAVVRGLSMFAVISLVFYWIIFAVFFGIRGIWPEGYNQISQTWKPALFMSVFAFVAIPAGLAWAGEVVAAGGMGGE